MIRPVTCVCMLLAAGSGLYLYQAKHQAQLLDKEIGRVLDAADAARKRAGMLRAEYALENDPSTLAELADTYLPELKTTQPGQFVAFADLGKRLPPVGAPAEDPAPVEEPPSVPVAGAEPAKPDPAQPEVSAPEVARTEPAKPEAPRPEPKPTEPKIAVVRPPPAPVAAAVPSAPPAAAPATRSVLAAARAPALPPGVVRTSVTSGGSVIHSTPLPPPTAAGRIGPPIPLAPPPRPAAASVVAARPVTRPAPYAAPPATPAEAIARIARGAPVDPSVPMVASALGMARTMMAAPSPVSPANAASLYRQTGSGDE